jgi:hypothetical protein
MQMIRKQYPGINREWMSFTGIRYRIAQPNAAIIIG